MNIEDRLREAFEQEAEHLHAPSGSPESAIRRGRRRRASNLIGGAALVVALIGGTAVGIQVLGTSAGPDPADGAPAAATQTASDPGDERREESTIAAAPDIEFNWDRVELPNPAGADVWNVQVAALGDRFVAVGNGTTELGGSGILTWTSSDGRNWAPGAPTGLEGQVDQIFGTSAGFVAVVQSYEGSGESATIYTSADGENWIRGTADLDPPDENTFSWFAGAAAGNGTTVLIGALQSEPEQPPLVFEAWGVRLEQNRFDGSFQVLDLETGESITGLPSEAVYGSGDVTVYHPDGTRLFTVPWQRMEEFIAAEENGGTAAVELEGYRLEMDFDSYTYVVTDAATGLVVAEGSQEELYRPPRLVVTDPSSGAVVLDITFEEFYEAQDRAYSERTPEYLPQSQALVLVSNDGATWDRIDLPGPQGASEGLDVNTIVYGPDGFTVTVFQYGGDFRADVLRSTDGRTWELADSTREPRQGGIVAHDGRYFSLSYDRRPGVAVSTDAIEWAPVFEAPGGDIFYNTLASGEFGIVALGQSQGGAFGPPLMISKDGRTLTLDYQAGSFTVTEDATGEELTVVEFDIWDEDPPDQFIVDDVSGTLTILAADGTELMTVTEEEGEAASRELEEQYAELYEETIPSPAVAYSPNGDDWFTVSTDGLDVAWAQTIAVGRDSVVIVGDSTLAYSEERAAAELYSEDSDGDTTVTTLAATEPYPAAPPTIHLWVGTPK